MFLLWHPSLTAINLSYTFPILETSATALCGTTGKYWWNDGNIQNHPCWLLVFQAIFCRYNHLEPQQIIVPSFLNCLWPERSQSLPLFRIAPWTTICCGRQRKARFSPAGEKKGPCLATLAKHKTIRFPHHYSVAAGACMLLDVAISHQWRHVGWSDCPFTLYVIYVERFGITQYQLQVTV